MNIGPITRSNTMTTFYDNLKAHLNDHKYTRGKFKGQAPADRYRRGRSHERVAEGIGFMCVMFHDTRIITAYPDGSIVLDSGGWWGATTTRAAFNDNIRRFRPGDKPGMYVDTVRKMGVSTTALKTAHHGYVVAYDGMKLSADGQVLTLLRTFKARRVNKDKSKAFDEALVASGFKQLYPMIYASVDESDVRGISLDDRRKYADNFYSYEGFLQGLLTITNPTEEDMTLWRRVVANNKYDVQAIYDRATNQYIYKHEARTKQDTWTTMLYPARQSFYHIVDTDITSF